MAGKPFTEAALATPCRVGRAALFVIETMSDMTWRKVFRPQIIELLKQIPDGTPEREVKRLMRGKGPKRGMTSWLPKIWCDELKNLLDVRFDRARFKNLGPTPDLSPNQLPLL